MIFLDLETPEYVSMRIQESKVPELLKTIRGKGIVETSNDFGYDERLHLNFIVNEENLIKLLQVQARFQTMCLIPMYSANLKRKIFNAYLEYQKNLLDTFMQNVGIDDKDKRSNILKQVYNANSNFLGINNIEELGYKVNPNINDCLMVFLESFSVKSIQTSSDGFEVEMILWICNDLTFYNGKEQEFLNDYYKKFSNKLNIFNKVDKQIIDFFKYKTNQNINIKMENAWNNQTTYNPNKEFEKIESPSELNIDNQYIQQLEVRMMNNLVRLPIIGKQKGFIQHLGKGEIGITIKLALNQKNALEEKIIHQIKSLALFQQEYITISDCDFYLFKAFDIKELNLCTSVIEEPSDDVDVTVVTLLFVGAAINKTEIEADYFRLMDRSNNNNTIKLFSNFLDIMISDNHSIKIPNDENITLTNNGTKYKEDIFSDSKNNKDKNKEDSLRLNRITKQMLLFSKLIINKSKTVDQDVSVNNDMDTQMNRDEEIKTILSDDFNMLDLILTYRQSKLPCFIDKMNQNKNKENASETDIQEMIEEYETVDNRGIGKICVRKNPRVCKDNMYYDTIKFRFQNVAYRMLITYANTSDIEAKNRFFNAIELAEDNTQAEFVDKVLKFFTVDFFTIDDLKDTRKRFQLAISAVFKIEVFNSLTILLKTFIDNADFNKYFGLNKINTPILKSDNKNDFKFNDEIKNGLVLGIKTVFQKMQSIVEAELFSEKVFIYMKENWFTDVNSEVDSSLRKGIEVEIKKFSERIYSLYIKLDSDSYLVNQIMLIFKLEILGIKLDTSNLFEGKYNIYGNDMNNQVMIYDSSEIENGVEVKSIKSRRGNYLYFNTELQSLLLGEIIMSLIMADIYFERSVCGVIAVESAKNFIGPFSISYSAIDKAVNDNVEILNNYIGKNIPDNLKEYQSKYDEFVYMKNVITRLFGAEAPEYFINSSSTFIRTSTTNKDFQSIYGIKVFNNFENPMEFIKNISTESKSYKDLFDEVFSMFNSLDNKLKNTTDRNVLDDIGKNIDTELMDKLIEARNEFLSYNQHVELIESETINKTGFSSNIAPASIMQSELLSEFKYVRALKSATKLLTSQYEMMLPDYEVYIIDERQIKMAFERGYDLQNKIYAMRNIISINIKKDDTTNLKTAIIKILNVRPFDIGLNTVFENKNILNDPNEVDEIVYNNKFSNNRMVFKPGLLVNISLDPNSDYYDFTGKIESVQIDKNIITLICSSFASELFGASMAIDNSYGSGFTNVFTKLKSSLSNVFNKKADTIKNSKIENVNSLIVPNAVYKEFEKDNSFNKAIAGATGIIYTALEYAGDSLKHLYTPYNDLLSGHDLTSNLLDTKSILSQTDFVSRMNIAQEIVNSRISENINSVDFDLAYYGLNTSAVSKSEQLDLETGADKYGGITKKQTDICKSSFIAQTFMDKNNTKDGAIFGELYSYQRTNAKTYDVLNDIQLRNPASYWDVIESGHYATLFLGRNNYMIKRKNKISSLTKTDVERMGNFLNEYFKNSELVLFEEQLYMDQVVDYIKLFRSLATIYDPSYAFDDEIVKRLKNFNENNPISVNYGQNNEVQISKNVEGYDLASNIHLAVSGHNLIACNIKTNENYHNTVDVTYKPSIADRVSRWVQIELGSANKVRLKSFLQLDDSRVRAKVVDPVMTKDLHTVYQAFEYAQSVMFQEMRNYYSGKIVTLYIPNLKKNDEILLIDSKHSIQGTVIVKDFQHILDSESGMITIITPGMKIKTSSLMNDIYLTGLWNEIRYEILSESPNLLYNPTDYTKNLTKINQSVMTELNKLFTNVTKSLPQIPVTFNNNGALFDFDENKKMQGKEKFEFLDNDNLDNFWTGINTPRNNSSLPMKLYPLIKNGQALIPDYDIYNTQSNIADSIGKVINTILYAGLVMDAFSESTGYIKDSLTALWNYLDVSDQGMYKEIIDKFLPGFNNFSTDDPDYRESLSARLVSDDYNNLMIDESTNITIKKGILNELNIGFLNCQKLNQFDDERIDKIAKIIFQFEIVNLVELDGRANNNNDSSKIDFESGNFTIIKKILNKLNELSKTYIKPWQTKNSENQWKVITQGRLLPEGPVKTNEFAYDDIGVVFYQENPYVMATESESITVSSKVEENGKIYEKSRKVLTYNLRTKGKGISFTPTKCFLFHNYYGENELSEIAVDYKTRCNLLDELLVKSLSVNFNVGYSVDSSLIIGDFNLRVIDRHLLRNKYANELANNNTYVISNGVNMVGLRTDESTTIGNKQYDQMIFTDSHLSLFEVSAPTKVFKNYLFNSSPDKLISDHYPIYTTLKLKKGR